MTQLADIIVKNGAATPVDVTYAAFVPQSGQNGATWYYKPAGSSRAEYHRMVLLTRRSGSNQATKSTVNITVPVFADQSGVRVKSYQIPIKFEVVMPDGVTDAVAKDVIVTAINLLGSNLVKDALITSSAVI